MNISIALPKGRLAEESIDLFISKNISNQGVVDFQSRKLIFNDKENNITFLMIRNMDIPSYVENGAADFGIIGKDILEELNPNLFELMDLGFGACRLAVAGIKDSKAGYHHNMKIATKYPNITKSFFAKKGFQVEMIKLYGSIEIAPIVGLSEFIVDLVSTGETIRKNGMVEIEPILYSTARLVANKYTIRAKHTIVKPFLTKLGVSGNIL